MFKRLVTSAIYILALGFIFSPSAIADEIIVSNNGDGSSSSVSVNSNNSSNVTQTNDTQVNNDVITDADTGSNQTSSNNGDSSINTGDVTVTTSINNEDINTNMEDKIGTCGVVCGTDGESTVSISGNGSNSLSSIDLGLSNNADIKQTNSANVTNNVGVKANTGYNTANNNNGDVRIETGNITAITAILNKNINLNIDPILSPFGALSVSISGNGDGSVNGIVLFFGNKLNYNGSNNTTIVNNVTHDLNTGENIANGNNGAVLIATGDIMSVVTIGNENINCNIFNSPINSCFPTGGIIPPPGGGPTTPPSTPPGSDNPSGTPPSPTSVGSSPGQVLGAAIGNVLPATGGYWMLLMTILCLTLFLLGGYLRFGSGISPPLNYAV